MMQLFLDETHKILVLVLLVCLCVAGCGKQTLDSGSWITIYEDDYNFAQSVATFNTWLWREDAQGTHVFNVTDKPQANCTSSSPCVQLTAPENPAATAYTNAEMYNNSCQPWPSGEGVDVDALNCSTSVDCSVEFGPWYDYSKECYACYASYCSQPYPYRAGATGKTPDGVNNSWNTSATGAVSLWRNPITILDSEKNWKGYRDLVFNVAYHATADQAQRISMGIMAEGLAGGSRGWGFWNTTMDPFAIQLAWFMEITDQASIYTPNKRTFITKNGVYMMTIGRSPMSGETGICVSTLDPATSIYKYHTYDIQWQAGALTYFVDGIAVAQHTTYVPDRRLSFHNWADNRNYSGKGPGNYPLYVDKTNYINAYRVQVAGYPPVPPAPAGPAATCAAIPLDAIAKGIEKDLIKGIVAWLIGQGLLPGPPGG